jgi:hypothetical protein
LGSNQSVIEGHNIDRKRRTAMVIWELLIPLELFLLVCFFLYLWRMEKRSRFLGHQEKRIKLADQLENLAKECA